MARTKHSRPVFIFAVIAVLAAGLAYAFWPRPLLVDIGAAKVAAMTVTIDEEGRTRVHNSYVVSTPIAGRLLRVEVEPGDAVQAENTIVARMKPISPSALDARTREQATANVTAAQAGLRVAEADLNKALADKELAETNLARTRKLFESGITSQAAMDREATGARLALANLDTARAAISMRIAELNNAQAQLISFDDHGLANAIAGAAEQVIELHAPASGVILQVNQQSETTLPAGSPIMEIGNIEKDLEIVAELLSTDAVQVRVGADVIIDNWGGPDALMGKVVRVEPWGFTKFSALGVEEQRVKVTIGFADPPEARTGLGHGFRVEVRIVVWQRDDALVVPASSLFRAAEDWAVFTVTADGRAAQRRVEVAANNGVSAAISAGLDVGEQIVLYPSAALIDGGRVAQRQTEGN
jgi:HlyD family secretion protein